MKLQNGLLGLMSMSFMVGFPLHATAQHATAQHATAQEGGEVPSGDHAEKGAEKKPEKKHCKACGGDFSAGIYAVGGLAFFDLDGLNDRLDASGYDRLDQPSIPIGIAGDARFRRLIIGGEYNRLRNFNTAAGSSDLRASMRGSYWLYRVGFDVLRWKGLHVYPMVGIGAGRVNLRIDEELDASFSDVLDDPGRSSTLVQRALLLDGTLAVDYRFAMRKRAHKTTFFVVGVRGGYMWAPYSSDWQTRSAEFSGGPDLGFTGPTVALNLGVSWKRHAHKTE